MLSNLGKNTSVGSGEAGVGGSGRGNGDNCTWTTIKKNVKKGYFKWLNIKVLK